MLRKSYGKKKVHLPGVAKVIKKCSDPLSSGKLLFCLIISR